MSKIFDGLKKTESEIARLTIEVLGDNAPARPETNGNGSATNGDTLETRSSRRSTGTAERFSDSGFVFENGGDNYQSPSDLSGHEGQDFSEQDHVAELAEPADDYMRMLEADSMESVLDTPRNAPPPKFSPPNLGYRSAVIRLRAGSPLLPFDTGEADAAAEEYRRVRTRISQHRLRPRLILVSSPAPGDGKSVTALNIGGALALNRDARVLLVDTDLRRPTIAGLLGITEAAGVAEVLSGSCTLENAVLRLEPFPNLFLLPAGRDRRNPVELLSSPQWKVLCEELRAQMTYTIFDGPPVDAVAEYSLLEETSDGLILVVRTHRTVRSLLYGALESIPKAKLIGTVINGYKESFFWKQRGDYY